ncbi:class I SAM-dependent methyltransferase [Bacillus sp. TH22]|uniref:class I SAM-dependent methyltransferase n=1 Tax=unclassified Bacillus (in: firmicutes) TaxID=185979 RepID=UPI001913071D|nr:MULTISPECIES: class I SAM-dependent methyltransferase [unclassified Bacillus (in: firmicutes)]MBK5452062.1 class I SAM-dependent methyltransferase [Bacillus sp. TH22]MBK5454201.1 class I SAM-dependent methyltransferase [Bacillus sp. TH23]
MEQKKCRFCHSLLKDTFIDLGVSPLANSFVAPENSYKMEPFYPLHTFVCNSCLLVQLDEFESPQNIFHDYLYFSSYSSSWLLHAKQYVEMAIKRFNLTKHSKVIEIASNDGYLLQYFQKENINTTGIEPAKNVAEIAIQKGVPTNINFFSNDLAKELISSSPQADLIIANNVLAHVPNLHDFVAGLKTLLKRDGTITIEFPHLLNLISFKQFDTIYHEHFSYFSLISLQKILAHYDLQIVDVEELSTHGGSLRVFINHIHAQSTIHSNVSKAIQKEVDHGLDTLDCYLLFSKQVEQLKIDILKFFIEVKALNKQVISYGAPAKGNTLLNYCGIGKEFLSYTVDKNPYKQNLLLPGTRIPIKSPEEIKRTKPDYILILPWNLKEEIMKECSFIREWGGKFLVMIPEVDVIEP